MCRRHPPEWARQLHLEVHQVSSRLETLMALVQVESDALDALDAALDEVATALEAKIESLKTSLPDADLSALDADVAALRALAAPAPEPPVVRYGESRISTASTSKTGHSPTPYSVRFG